MLLHIRNNTLFIASTISSVFSFAIIISYFSKKINSYVSLKDTFINIL